MSRSAAKIIGIVTGLVLGLYIAFYLPMSSNYKQCGTIFLCR